MDSQLVRIARAIKDRRKQMDLSLEDLAQRAGVSRSLVSKVENSRAIPSMPVLIKVARGLQIALSELISGTETSGEPQFVVIRSSDYAVQEKEDAVGFRYENLFSRILNDSLFEVSILSVEPQGKRQPVQSDGSEFLYIIEGEVDFHLEEEVVTLTTGDALFFDGRISHVPVNNAGRPARMLVIYLIDPEKHAVKQEVPIPLETVPFRHYSEAIRQKERWRRPLEFAETVAAASAVRYQNSLDLLGEPLLRGDCHAHSDHSDGVATVEEIATMVAIAQLDFQWVTDHWGISQADECRRHGLWVGQEPAAGLHHLGILSLGTPFVPQGEIIADFARVEEAGGTPFIPHPTGWWPDNTYRQEQLDALWNMPKTFLMEIINGGDNLARAYDYTDAAAVQLWDRLLIDGFRVHAMANTDAHLPHQFGIAWNGVSADACTESSVLAALRAGRFFASEGPVFSFQVGATEMGSQVDIRGEKPAFSLRVADAAGLLAVRVIADGEVVHTWHPDGARLFEHTATIPKSAHRYIRAEAVSNDGCRGFTNPVYLS